MLKFKPPKNFARSYIFIIAKNNRLSILIQAHSNTVTLTHLPPETTNWTKLKTIPLGKNTLPTIIKVLQEIENEIISRSNHNNYTSTKLGSNKRRTGRIS